MEEEKYPYIKKYLGENWLKNLINLNKSLTWVNEEPKTEEHVNIGYLVLKKIDEIISNFEEKEGFDKWIKEVRTASYKNFQHLLFELMSLENLLKKSDYFQLKPPPLLNGKNPDALIKKDNLMYYIENTFLDGIPSSITNKTSELFNKSKERFHQSE
jgi:hypothetical protein